MFQTKQLQAIFMLVKEMYCRLGWMSKLVLVDVLSSLLIRPFAKEKEKVSLPLFLFFGNGNIDLHFFLFFKGQQASVYS